MFTTFSQRLIRVSICLYYWCTHSLLFFFYRLFYPCLDSNRSRCLRLCKRIFSFAYPRENNFSRFLKMYWRSLNDVHCVLRIYSCFFKLPMYRARTPHPSLSDLHSAPSITFDQVLRRNGRKYQFDFMFVYRTRPIVIVGLNREEVSWYL